MRYVNATDTLNQYRQRRRKVTHNTIPTNSRKNSIYLYFERIPGGISGPAMPTATDAQICMHPANRGWAQNVLIIQLRYRTNTVEQQ